MTTATRTRQIEVFSPTIGPKEQAAVAAVLASGWLGAGPKVAEFERAWAAHIGVPVENVVAVSCATEGLFQVVALFSSRCNASVVVPGNVYIGALNALEADLRTGFDWCDIDPHTLNPTVEMLPQLGEGVLLQHFGGVPSDLENISDYCKRDGLTLIEDCACAPASTVNGKPAGTFGDFGVWSFDAMKVMTCGDGGMVYCREAGDADAIRRATRLGLDNLSGQSSGETSRWWEFQVQVPGRRAMMNDIGAAIGLEQLRVLPTLVWWRQERWSEYQQALAGLDWLTLPPEPPVGVKSSYYCYWVQLERRDELAVFLRERGVYTTYRYWPPHRAYGWPANLPGVDYATDHTLLLPLHANLSVEDVVYICEQVREFGRLHA